VDRAIFGLTLLTSLGIGLMSGLFFTFSNFAMKALGRLPAPQGIAAMNSINVTILNPLFLLVFAGTAVLSAMLAVAAIVRWYAPGSGYLLSGSLIYLAGAFLVTGVCNVPMNNALARVDPASADAARFWADYVTRWTAWNHVRTFSSIAALALLIFALCALRPGAPAR
jgi:uncharacterized membrane protein